VLRTFLLRHHYRTEWSFREEDLELEGRVEATVEAGGGEPRFDPENDRAAFFRALDQDLDTPTALRILDRAGRSDDPAGKELAEEGKALLGLDLKASTIP
jgi:cysteinyl-tRNA synthetase